MDGLRTGFYGAPVHAEVHPRFETERVPIRRRRGSHQSSGSPERCMDHCQLERIVGQNCFFAIQKEMEKRIKTDQKRNWRFSHRTKNIGNESENDKLSDMQIKRNCESAFNTKKCSNNRLVLDSIWSKKRKRNDKVDYTELEERKEQKERILEDINLGDDIETMAKILDLTSRNDFELQLDDHIRIIENWESFLKNKLAFFYVKLDDNYYSHVKKIVNNVDREYKEYYDKKSSKKNFPLKFDPDYLLGGYPNYTAWKYLNVKELRGFLNHHCPLKEILYNI